MSFNVTRALFLPFSDLKNILPITVFTVNMILFAIFNNYAVFLLMALFAFIQMGYIYVSTHNELNDQSELFPKWNVFKCLYVFLCNTIIKLCYSLIFSPIFLIIFFVIMFSPILAIFIIIPFAIAFSIFMFYTEFAYLKNLKISEAFNFSKNFDMLYAGYKEALIAFLWSIVVSIPIILVVSLVIFMICLFTIGLQSLITQSADIFTQKDLFKMLEKVAEIVMNFYVLVASYNLLAQAYKNTEKLVIPDIQDYY